ncbi:MAG: TIGR03067 domain-containing protein [Ferruginibacter sp.]
MKTSLIILVFVFALSCRFAGDAAKSTDKANIQGTWLAQSESQNGIKKNVSYLYVFTEDKVTFTDETGKEIKYSFKLDTTGNPRLMIIQSDDTLINPAPVSVAYELDGDSLKIVVAPPGLRPTEISDKNNQELIICKRKGS